MGRMEKEWTKYINFGVTLFSNFHTTSLTIRETDRNENNNEKDNCEGSTGQASHSVVWHYLRSVKENCRSSRERKAERRRYSTIMDREKDDFMEEVPKSSSGYILTRGSRRLWQVRLCF